MGRVSFPGHRTINEPEYARSIRVLRIDDFRSVVCATDRDAMKRLDDGKLVGENVVFVVKPPKVIGKE
jgi:hypothetical protein